MDKLQKRLNEVNKELEICRNKRISNYGKNSNYFKSQAYWKLERKWDYLAMEKFELEKEMCNWKI